MAWMVASVCFSITHPDQENRRCFPSSILPCVFTAFSGFCRHRQVARAHLSHPQVTPGQGSASTGARVRGGQHPSGQARSGAVPALLLAQRSY